MQALEQVLPAVGGEDLYRITLTGECAAPDLEALYRALERFPNLELEDHTVLPMDLWAGAGEDTLEGVFFGKLRDVAQEAPETAELAARISRLLLSEQEVPLP